MCVRYDNMDGSSVYCRVFIWRRIQVEKAKKKYFSPSSSLLLLDFFVLFRFTLYYAQKYFKCNIDHALFEIWMVLFMEIDVLYINTIGKVEGKVQRKSVFILWCICITMEHCVILFPIYTLYNTTMGYRGDSENNFP